VEQVSNLLARFERQGQGEKCLLGCLKHPGRFFALSKRPSPQVPPIHEVAAAAEKLKQFSRQYQSSAARSVSMCANRIEHDKIRRNSLLHTSVPSTITFPAHSARNSAHSPPIRTVPTDDHPSPGPRTPVFAHIQKKQISQKKDPQAVGPD
jgi:hypothetical protein